MINNEELYNKIKDFYTRTLHEIRIGNRQKAETILYKEMPRSIYDRSLDLLYQANNKSVLPEASKKLFDLIEEVDDLLNPSEGSLKDLIEGLPDISEEEPEETIEIEEPETQDILKEELTQYKLNSEEDETY